MVPRFVHLSGAEAGTVTAGVSRTRSGSPIDHSLSSPKSRGAGMSAGSPSGAPLSTHRATSSISSSLSDESFL